MVRQRGSLSRSSPLNTVNRKSITSLTSSIGGKTSIKGSNSSKLNMGDLKSIEKCLSYGSGGSSSPLGDSAHLSETQRKQQRGALRKKRILEFEEEKRNRSELSDLELEQQQARAHTVQQAQNIMDEQMDAVKTMNRMMLYAQCVTIRDKQTQEKELVSSQRKDEESRLDRSMMEYRAKKEKVWDEHEAKRQKDLKESSKHIVDQIKLREAKRQRDREAREQAGIELVKQLKRKEEEEERQRREKAAEGRRQLEEIKQANALQARMKYEARQRELAEERKIELYLADKQQREMKYEEELERARIAKEREITKLRDDRMKALDRQAEMDELRARRHQEALDRRWRKQKLEEAKKKQRMMLELQQARDEQRQEKLRRVTEEAAREKMEYMKILEWQEQQAKKQNARDAELKVKMSQNNNVLQQLVKKRDGLKKEHRAQYAKERQAYMKEIDGYNHKLESIRQEKLRQLEEMGVPEKYRAELQSAKFY